MRPTGTEPGDFVEFDLDMIEADRRQRLRTALQAAKAELESELDVELTLSNQGNELVLTDDDGTRFTGSIGPDGRLVITDHRANNVL